jgi:hypothetical protein
MYMCPLRRSVHLNLQGSCYIYVICICLRIVVSNAYCVVFLLCLSSSCVPYVVSVHFGVSLLYSLTFILNQNEIVNFILRHLTHMLFAYNRTL